MNGGINSGLEIRRLVLLTLLRSARHGRTLEQLVRECRKVAGWLVAGKTGTEAVLLVLQGLIDDALVGVTRGFFLTTKGRDYLEDPSKWRVDYRATEDVEERSMFWNTIYATVYETVDRVIRRLRPGASPRRSRRRDVAEAV